jgi:phosphatidylinositol-3-phosphatase
MKKIILFTLFCLLLTACQGQQAFLSGAQPVLVVSTPAPGQVIATPMASKTPSAASSPTTAPSQKPEIQTNSPVAPSKTPHVQAPQAVLTGKIPNFDHIILTVLENEDYQSVIGNPQMPNLNSLAKKYVLLSNYFAVSHPSLPNYISLMSGDTQNITSDCSKCFVNAPNIADLVESSGRTWKSYEEDMPSACYLGDNKLYAQKHDPLLYFDSVRLNPTRCNQNIVPLTQLETDLAANRLPNFSFVMANLCNSGHDCALNVSDVWIGNLVNKLTSSPALGKNSLIVIVYDEGAKANKGSCCGLDQAGGQVAALLISPLAKPGFTDTTAYDHYSVLKTILTAWNLPPLGKTQDPATLSILAPWQQ